MAFGAGSFPEPSGREWDRPCPLCVGLEDGKIDWCPECEDHECADGAHAMFRDLIKCPLCGGDGEIVVGDGFDAEAACADALGALTT